MSRPKFNEDVEKRAYVTLGLFGQIATVDTKNVTKNKLAFKVVKKKPK